MLGGGGIGVGGGGGGGGGGVVAIPPSSISQYNPSSAYPTPTQFPSSAFQHLPYSDMGATALTSNPPAAVAGAAGQNSLVLYEVSDARMG